MDRLNAGIIELGCSPFSFGRANERDKTTHGRRKVEQIHLAANISRLFGLSQDDISIPPIHRQTCEKCYDLEEILSSIKEKNQTSSKKQSIQLLTLTPTTWSIEKKLAFSKLLVKWLKQQMN